MSGSFEDFSRAMSNLGRNLPGEVDRTNERWALIGLARVKLAASGRPGPRRVTGDYTRSMNAQIARAGNRIEATIGTNAVQAARLEFGFHGSDSLGRRYRQPAFPHWRPTFEFIQAGVVRDIAEGIEQSVRRSLGG